MKQDLEKCEFAMHYVKLFGSVIGRDGVCPNPEKVAAILNMRSKSVPDIRLFLRVCGYFRHHIEVFATITRSLTRLTKKGVKFE